MSPTQNTGGTEILKDKKALLVAQEISFAKILSGNDPIVRERGIKRLRKWLAARSSSSIQFKENDLNRIWMGLFYCMWMSDKPLVQEEVAENISNLVHSLKNSKAYLCFVKCFFHTVALEWRGLDHWRMDKFQMFIRRFIRQMLVYLKQRSWPVNLVKDLGAVLNSTVLPDHKVLESNCHPPIGFTLHFLDVYMDELTKVSKGKLQNDDLLSALLRPFVIYLTETPERTVGSHVVSQIFDRLIEQSKEGHKFREKFEAWKQLGYPRGNIDAIERVVDSDTEDEMDQELPDDAPQDPRAGEVCVELPTAIFNPETVANLLREYQHSKTSNSWSRRILSRVIARYSSVAKGVYPLGVKRLHQIPKINFKKLAKQSAQDFLDFRDIIMNEDDDDLIEQAKSQKNKIMNEEEGDSMDQVTKKKNKNKQKAKQKKKERRERKKTQKGTQDDETIAEVASDGTVEDDEVKETIGGVGDSDENEGENVEENNVVTNEDDENNGVEDSSEIKTTDDEQDDFSTPKYSKPLEAKHAKKKLRRLMKKKVKMAAKEEIVVIGRKRKLSEANSTPLLHCAKLVKSVQKSPRTPLTPGSAKKVHFILQKNTVQATSEYDKVLRENPGNPYDSAKKPRYSVLKSTPLASPVNPFYTPKK